MSEHHVGWPAQHLGDPTSISTSDGMIQEHGSSNLPNVSLLKAAAVQHFNIESFVDASSIVEASTSPIQNEEIYQVQVLHLGDFGGAGYGPSLPDLGLRFDAPEIPNGRCHIDGSELDDIDYAHNIDYEVNIEHDYTLDHEHTHPTMPSGRNLCDRCFSEQEGQITPLVLEDLGLRFNNPAESADNARQANLRDFPFEILYETQAPKKVYDHEQPRLVKPDVQEFLDYMTNLMPKVHYDSLSCPSFVPWSTENIALRYCTGNKDSRKRIELAIMSYGEWSAETRTKRAAWLTDQLIHFRKAITDWNQSTHHSCPPVQPTGVEIARYNDPIMFRRRAIQYVSSPSNGFRNEAALILHGQLFCDQDSRTQALIKSLERRRLLWVLLTVRARREGSDQSHGLPPPASECPGCANYARNQEIPISKDNEEAERDLFFCRICTERFPCCFVCDPVPSRHKLFPPWELPEWASLAIGHRDMLVYEYYASMDRIQGRTGISFVKAGPHPDHWHPPEDASQELETQNRQEMSVCSDITFRFAYSEEGDERGAGVPTDILGEFLDYSEAYGSQIHEHDYELPENAAKYTVVNTVENAVENAVENTIEHVHAVEVTVEDAVEVAVAHAFEETVADDSASGLHENE